MFCCFLSLAKKDQLTEKINSASDPTTGEGSASKGRCSRQEPEGDSGAHATSSFMSSFFVNLCYVHILHILTLLPDPYQSLEYQTDMRRCRFDPLGKQPSAHLAGGPPPYTGWVPPARGVSADAA